MQDLRQAFRTLRARPGFAAAAILTLALGIGATTAIFSVVYGVLFRPLPYPQADRLVRLGGGHMDLADVAARTDVFAGVGITASNVYAVDIGDGATEQMRGDIVSPSFFDVVGLTPVLGSVFTAAEERQPVAVIADDLWRRHYGADPGVLGKTIRLNRKSYTIIGVMPPAMRLPSPKTVLWTPLEEAMIGWPERENRQLRIARGVARLAPGVDLPRARAAVDGVMAQLAAEHPDTNRDVRMGLTPLHDAIVGDVRSALLVLLATVALVLLIAAGNVANLMLARTASREREIAVRRALGAGRWRLTRLILSESMVLSLAGGVLGVLFAMWGASLLQSLSPADIPRLGEVRVDAPVLLFAIVVSTLTGALFAIAPIVGVLRPPLAALITTARGSTEARRGGRLRGALVVSQIALSLVLVAGATLLISSFVNLLRAERGYRTEHMLTFSLPPGPTKEGRQAFLQQAVERIAALPGVEAVGGANSMPPNTLQRAAKIVPAGVPESEARQTPWIISTPDYFRALGADLLLGRGFTAADAAGAPPVVVINRSLARTLYRDESPIGKSVRVLVPGIDPEPRTIVGVVNDVKYTGLDQDGEIAVFTPWAQTPWPGMYVSVRTAGEPMALARSVSEALAALDSTQSVVAMASMETVTAASVATPRFYTLMLGLFGAVALLLAVIGIYGVIAYDVAQRTRELGIRLALGARPRALVAMVVRQGAWLAGAGIVLGLAGAFAATRILAGMLYGVGATDVRVLGAAALFLGAVAVGASLVAARRAQSVDPMTALRAE